MKIRKQIVLLLFISMLIIGISAVSNAEENMIPDVPPRQLDFDGDISYLYENPDFIPTGDTYYLFDPLPGSYGGYWADAEKSPTNTEDDLACWAATASNMLEWTGWGFTGGMENQNTDDFFAYFQDHTTDKGSLIEYALEWWFTGHLNNRSDPTNWSSEDVEGGDFWSSSYTWTDYTLWHWNATTTLQKIDEWLHAGYAVGIAIYPITPPGGHAITVWGFEYDTSFDKTDPDEVHDYYLGIYVTDSDNNKNTDDPPDVLSYVEVNYDDTNNYWYFGGWKIGGVTALKPFPGETRPIANVGGPYIQNEGTTVSFDASSSTDDDSLKYRWDFNADGAWDTGWLTSSTTTHTWYDDYTGDIYLEIFDGRLRDRDATTVTINNVAPTVNAGANQNVDEGDIVNFLGTYSDPAGTLDEPFIIEWNFGDTYTDSGAVNPTHTYCDNGIYIVTLTVTDKDGGSNSDTLTVTVNNVAPVADAGDNQTVNENETVYLTGFINDAGTCDDLTYEWDFGDGSATVTDTLTPTHIYGDNGEYTVTLTVTDDDAESDADTLTVTVNNVNPSITSEISMAWPYPGNPGYVLPIIHNLEFTATAYDQGSDDLTFTWDWNDSSIDTNIYYNDGTNPDGYPSPDINPITVIDTITHTYAQPGTYHITLTVTDDDGGIVTAVTYELIVLDIEGAKHHINDYIQNLPDSAFKGKADKRKNAFDNMFDALDDMLADKEYWGMIQHLNNNIRTKCDGTIDGKPGDDWISDPDAQYHICVKIDDLTAYIATYL